MILMRHCKRLLKREYLFFLKLREQFLQRDIPYSAISQAFQILIRQLLGEPENILQAWKEKILEALGKNSQIIIDVIPEVEKIIGKQQPVELLGGSESQNRFHLFFKRFVNVFSQKENPLVIFIDDLQWADLPSLNLIEQLISDSDIKYFLIIGAYRDNEVSSIHPLMNTLENGWSIRKKNDKYVFRKKHDRHTEIYSDEYLVNFLKLNMGNTI